ncbi:MAG: hypothetical protein AAGG51_04370 [Cyanobacteria bacterium P01_G01_bin.54]
MSIELDPELGGDEEQQVGKSAEQYPEPRSEEEQQVEKTKEFIVYLNEKKGQIEEHMKGVVKKIGNEETIQTLYEFYQELRGELCDCWYDSGSKYFDLIERNNDVIQQLQDTEKSTYEIVDIFYDALQHNELPEIKLLLPPQTYHLLNKLRARISNLCSLYEDQYNSPNLNPSS